MRHVKQRQIIRILRYFMTFFVANKTGLKLVHKNLSHLKSFPNTNLVVYFSIKDKKIDFNCEQYQHR